MRDHLMPHVYCSLCSLYVPRRSEHNIIFIRNLEIAGNKLRVSLRKQPTFGDATTGFPVKWRLRSERRNSILMRRHYLDLGSASDWLNQISYAALPIRSTTQISIVTCHQYGISALVSERLFVGETSGSVAKYRLFSSKNHMCRDLF